MSDFLICFAWRLMVAVGAMRRCPNRTYSLNCRFEARLSCGRSASHFRRRYRATVRQKDTASSGRRISTRKSCLSARYIKIAVPRDAVLTTHKKFLVKAIAGSHRGGAQQTTAVQNEWSLCERCHCLHAQCSLVRRLQAFIRTVLPSRSGRPEHGAVSDHITGRWDVERNNSPARFRISQLLVCSQRGFDQRSHELHVLRL